MKLQIRLVLCLLVDVFAASGLFAADRPNVVVILADDLGYGDPACYGGKIATPFLDQLAREGIRFTDAHTSSGVCTPTRYGLLTGRYNWRTKLQSGVLGGLSPRLIEPNRMTIASLLKANGYHTGCVGKWHLGMDWALKPGQEVTELSIESRKQVSSVDYGQPIANGPNSVGFDYYFGISASLDMVPYAFIENDRVTSLPTEDRDFLMMHDRPTGGRTRPGPTAPDFDAANVLPTLTQKAIEYIGKRCAKTIGQQGKKSTTENQPFFLYVPLASPHTPILPTAEWQNKSGINPYADFVMQTDSSIGEIIKAIDHFGIASNTLLIVTSDNGCSPQAKFEELAKHDHHPSGPLRGHKADIFEGGHRVPFFVRWPGRAAAGSVSTQLVCLTDIMATVAEITNIPLPANAAEDSISFLESFKGKPSKRNHVVSHSINGSFAVRQGDWKLLLCPDSGGWSEPRPGKDSVDGLPSQQLYNLASDLGERNNVIESEPDRARQLTELLSKFVAEGRSTPGPSQKNFGEINFLRKGK
ncbi:MAG: arylsulfatase [Pirellulaceae bacterium]|nr:arylsulfatase [Pirellulaceae bacterium]